MSRTRKIRDLITYVVLRKFHAKRQRSKDAKEEMRKTQLKKISQALRLGALCCFA